MLHPGQMILSLQRNIGKAVVGKEEAVEYALIALLCKGHVLIEDVPGVGKTTLASALAKSLDCSFRRIQFTPDLMPSDVTGFTLVNFKTGEMEYSNGGHNSPVILRANGQVEMLPTSGSCMVGAIEGVTYKNEHITLGVGDTIVMYTDGVNEAMNSDFQEFGDERLEASLKKCAGQSCQQLIESVKADVAAYVGEAEQSDDITLFALKRK